MGLFDDIISGIEKGLDDAAHEVVGVASTVGNTIEGGVDDLYHAIFGGGSSSSGGGSVDTGSDVSLTDIRWEGMSNEQLAQVVNQLSQGQGAGGMQEAADVLSGIAAALQSMDDTLRQQLQAIGVSWQSDASSLAQQMSKTAADYAGAAGDSSSTASGGISQTGDGYSQAKNSVAPAPTLNGPSSTSTTDNVVHTLTGISTDHAKQVAQTNAARTQTIDGLRNYADSAQSGINSYSAPPVPPNLGLTTSSVDTSLGQMGSVAGYSGGSASVAGGGAAGSGAIVGAPAVPGAPGSFPTLPPVGGGIGGGIGGGVGGPQLPGGQLPGPVSGVGPNPTSGSFGGPIPSTIGNYEAAIEEAGVASVVATGGAAGGVAGATGGGRSSTRSTPSEPQNKDVFADDPEFQDAAGAKGEAVSRATKPLVSFEEAPRAAEALAAERYGAKAAQAEPQFLEPAMGARRGEDDETHGSKYVEGEDLFEDDRLVMPAVIDTRQPTPPPPPAANIATPNIATPAGTVTPVTSTVEAAERPEVVAPVAPVLPVTPLAPVTRDTADDVANSTDGNDQTPNQSGSDD